MAAILQLKDFLDQIEKESNRRYTWLIGAGVSVTAGMPSVKTVNKIIILFEYISKVLKVRPWDNESNTAIHYELSDLKNLIAWYDEKDVNPDQDFDDLNNVAFSWIKQTRKEFINIDIASSECYQIIFKEVLQDSDIHHKFLTALVTKNLGSNLAHLCLAAILRDYNYFSHTVFTTNFDDLLLKSLLSINHTGRIFGDLDSIDVPKIDPTHPQIVHLHGRHTGYRLKNTKDQISLIDPNLKRSFEEHLKSSSLIVLGYSGWDDLVMKTLSSWIANPNLIQGQLIWVPYQNSSTILSETKNFLDTCPPSKAIILENDGVPLNADLFMLSVLNTLNKKKNGFAYYRKEILEIAIQQHRFIMEQLKLYPFFDPESIINEKLKDSYNFFRIESKDKAINAYTLAKLTVESEDLPIKLRAESYFKIGIMELCFDLNEEAIATLEKSEKLWSEVKNHSNSNHTGILGEAEAYRAMADVHLKLGEVDNAITKLKIARSKYNQINNQIGVAYSCIKQAEVFIRIGNADMAERLLTDAHFVTRQSSDTQVITLFYKSRADLDKLKVKYSSAEMHYVLALDNAKQLDLPLLKAELMKNIGSMLITRRAVVEGMSYLEKAEAIFRKENNILGIANIHGSIGDYKLLQKNIAFALDEYLKAYDILKNSIHLHGLGNTIADIIHCEILSPTIVDDLPKYLEQGKSLIDKSRNAYLKGKLEKYFNQDI
ncbi:MAG TPA: SIR2 family protein [Flavipsychrobacter sp.]|nr:SIR2 family protein [Flavipsychrobacter sp.]